MSRSRRPVGQGARREHSRLADEPAQEPVARVLPDDGRTAAEVDQSDGDDDDTELEDEAAESGGATERPARTTPRPSPRRPTLAAPTTPWACTCGRWAPSRC